MTEKYENLTYEQLLQKMKEVDGHKNELYEKIMELDNIYDELLNRVASLDITDLDNGVYAGIGDEELARKTVGLFFNRIDNSPYPLFLEELNNRVSSIHPVLFNEGIDFIDKERESYGPMVCLNDDEEERPIDFSPQELHDALLEFAERFNPTPQSGFNYANIRDFRLHLFGYTGYSFDTRLNYTPDGTKAILIGLIRQEEEDYLRGTLMEVVTALRDGSYVPAEHRIDFDEEE